MSMRMDLSLGVQATGTALAAYALYKAVSLAKGAWFKLSLYKPKMEYFDGKVIWITGASSGIGRELARQLVTKAGCKDAKPLKLILSSRRRKVLEQVKMELVDLGTIVSDNIAIVPLDLEDQKSLDQSVGAAFGAFGHVDMLVNNAGISQRSLARMTSPDVYAKLMAIDYVGQVTLTQQYVSKLVESGGSGHIVMVSSVAGKLPVPFRSGYCAAKAALNAYADTLRIELDLEKYPISVTVISPGGVKTDVSRNALDSKGKPFGTADAVTMKGMDVDKCVSYILTGVSNKLDDVIVSSNLELFAVKLFSFLPLSLATKVMVPKYAKYLRDTLEKVK
jgi:short-subunit dehydrogenase